MLLVKHLCCDFDRPDEPANDHLIFSQRHALMAGAHPLRGDASWVVTAKSSPHRSPLLVDRAG